MGLPTPCCRYTRLPSLPIWLTLAVAGPAGAGQHSRGLIFRFEHRPPAGRLSPYVACHERLFGEAVQLADIKAIRRAQLRRGAQGLARCCTSSRGLHGSSLSRTQVKPLSWGNVTAGCQFLICEAISCMQASCVPYRVAGLSTCQVAGFGWPSAPKTKKATVQRIMVSPPMATAETSSACTR